MPPNNTLQATYGGSLRHSLCPPHLTPDEPFPRETGQLRSTTLLHPANLSTKSCSHTMSQRAPPEGAASKVDTVHSEVALDSHTPSGYQVREALGSRKKAPTPAPAEIYTGDTEGQPYSRTYPMHRAEKGFGNTLICPLCFKFQVISCPASRLQFSG